MIITLILFLSSLVWLGASLYEIHRKKKGERVFSPLFLYSQLGMAICFLITWAPAVANIDFNSAGLKEAFLLLFVTNASAMAAVLISVIIRKNIKP